MYFQHNNAIIHNHQILQQCECTLRIGDLTGTESEQCAMCALPAKKNKTKTMKKNSW